MMRYVMLFERGGAVVPCYTYDLLDAGTPLPEDPEEFDRETEGEGYVGLPGLAAMLVSVLDRTDEVVIRRVNGPEDRPVVTLTDLRSAEDRRWMD